MKKLFFVSIIFSMFFLIFSCSEDGKSALQKRMEEAAKRNEAYKEKMEAEKSKKPDWKDDEEKKPLPLIFEAMKNGDISKVKLLINSGTDVNTVDHRKKTLLMEAAAKGDKELVSFLLERGANVKAKRVDGDTALMAAIIANSEEIVELLLEKGADPLAVNNFGRTTVMVAAMAGNMKLVDLMIKKKVDINAKDKYLKNALIFALKNKHKDVALKLLKKGAMVKEEKLKPAKIRKIDKDTPFEPILIKRIKSPIFFAAEMGDVKLVKLLHKKGAPIVVNDILRYKEFKVTKKGGKEEETEYVKEESKKVTNYDDKGKNLLMYAAEAGSVEVVKFFVKKGAKIEEKEPETLRHPLFFVVTAEKGDEKKEKGLAEVAAYLVKKGKDKHKVQKVLSKHEQRKAEKKNKGKDWFEDKKKGFKEVEVPKIDIEDYDYEGWTVLTQAAMNGHNLVIKELIKGQVLVNRKERKFGKTALMYARSGKFNEIEKTLIDAGAKEGVAFDIYGNPNKVEKKEN